MQFGMKEGKGLLPTALDITDNPRHLQIMELEGAQLPRVLDDPKVDVAIISTTYIQQTGLSPVHDQKAEPLFGDEPWWVRDLAKETGTDEQAMRLTLRQAAQQGIITAIVKDRYYRNDRIVEFANMIRDLDQECGSTCAADFRDRLGVGRKLAIQILEYFDRIDCRASTQWQCIA